MKRVKLSQKIIIAIDVNGRTGGRDKDKTKGRFGGDTLNTMVIG